MRLNATRTCRWARAVCLTAGLTGVLIAAPAGAADDRYESPTAAYRQGLAALRGGSVEEAVRGLEYAAEKGVLGAQLKLAELYASGDGFPKRPIKAFRLYQKIANQYADTSPRHPVARYVAKAFVALAGYHRDGIPELGLEPDPTRAADLCRHAASYFGDVTAQYELARMYLDGEGVHRNRSLAVNWLANAAKKQHAPSQALLGDLLWRGEGELARQRLKGLALLSVARRNAAGTKDAEWIEKLFARAIAEARPEERAQANELAAHWRWALSGAQEPHAPWPAADPPAAPAANAALPERPAAPAILSPDPLQKVDASQPAR